MSTAVELTVQAISAIVQTVPIGKGHPAILHLKIMALGEAVVAGGLYSPCSTRGR